MIDNSKISEILNKVVTFYQPDKVLLFGSYAIGKANEDSDLDLIIVKKTNKPKHKRGREVRKFLYGSMIPIDLKIYTPQEFETEKISDYTFLNSVINNCITLYERKD